MKNKILISCLFYINEDNESYRLDNCLQSLKSLQGLDKKYCDIVAISNNCSKSFNQILESQNLFDQVFYSTKNFWDISVIYSAAYLALKKEYKYCLYTYDDFVFYKYSFLKDSIDFLNSHKDCSCIRIPSWEYENMNLYNSQITPKSINPDSVRHYHNTGFDENSVSVTSTQPLNWEGPFAINQNIFYKTNWHYVSRPTIWNSKELFSFFNQDNMPVMQKLECNLGAKFQSLGKKTGVLDGGCCHTFKESIRSKSPGVNNFVDIKEFKNFLNSF